jgi:hypothetical protein
MLFFSQGQEVESCRFSNKTMIHELCLTPLLSAPSTLVSLFWFHIAKCATFGALISHEGKRAQPVSRTEPNSVAIQPDTLYTVSG